MAAYRIYLLGPGDRFMKGEDALCDSDAAALAEARAKLAPGERAEVWEGTRCLGQVAGGELTVRAPAFERLSH